MANYDNTYLLILQNEGGYVNDPTDKGGETYAGISRKFNPKWLGWLIIDKAKSGHGFNNAVLSCNQYLQNLVREFYKENYWDKVMGDSITSQKVANVIVDFGINAGLSTSVKMSQKIANALVDGNFGPNTLHAIESMPEADFLNEFADARILYYEDIVKKNPTQAKYLNGWKARAERFRS